MRKSNVRGITLIEMLVVMTLIALMGSIVGPAIARRIDTIALQTTATELAAQLRRAQAVARENQTPVAMTYSDHVFRFWKAGKSVAVYNLPGAISPAAAEVPTFLFLPSGQILGAGNLELRNQNGRKIVIATDGLKGIGVNLGAAS